MSQTEKEPGRRPPPTTPGWVKVSLLIVVVLVLVFVILHLAGISPMGHQP